MDSPSAGSSFRWASPLGFSVGLFLVSGAVHLLIGILTPVFGDLELGRRILIISTRTDTQLFGAAPSALLEANADLARFRSLVFNNVGGSLILLGVFIVSLAWFGLRCRLEWAYWTLTLTGFLILPFWYLTFRPYVRSGISFGFADLPPIFWIPGVILIPAAVSGWIGLRRPMDDESP